MTKTADILSDVIFNEASAPEFIRCDGKYTIASKENKPYSAGMYTTTVDIRDSADKLLEITIPFSCSGKRISPRVLASFLDKSNNLIQSDYFQKQENRFSLKTEIPENAAQLKLEMLLYCFDKGKVTFENPLIKTVEKEPHRIVRVASAFIERIGTFEDNFKNTLAVIDEASNSDEKPDILCFTECVLDLSCKERCYINENDEKIRKICVSAKKSGMYVIFTSHEIDDEGYKYNTSFLISDKGELIGKYRKVFLTGMGELKNGGMTPGSDLPVFDTPIGKIGMLICWDNWFPEAARELCKKGAEMIFWSTRGFHEERAAARAMDNGVYYIVSNPNPKNCGIIEPAYGKYIARADGSKNQGFVSAPIDLDKRLVSQYKSFGKNGSNDKNMFIIESELR